MILREIGIAFLAAVGAGVVSGLAARVAMKISALANPSELIRITANGNVVGDLTVDGTFALFVFAGIAPGLLAGGLYGAMRPWLARIGRWDGLGFGAALLLLGGSAVFETTNSDFRRFGPPALNLILFAAPFLILGTALAVLWRVAGRLPARVLTGLGWLGALAIGGAMLTIGAGVVRAIAMGSEQTLGEATLGLGLIVATTVLALVLRRFTGVSRASVTALAVPILIGAVATARAAGFVLAG